MDIILTHEQADFDAAGSVLAAWLLDPSRYPVLSKRRNRNLATFLDDYKSRLPFFTWKTLPKGPVTRIYITDTQVVGAHQRMEGVKDVIVWDHHPHRHLFPDRDENIYDPTGACTTFLVEKLMEKPDQHPGRIYATLMLMGIYEDTGSLSYGSTTPRDIRAAAWLVEKGADLDLMRRYVLQPMTDYQQQGFNLLMKNLKFHEICGEQIAVASADIREISDEFSAVAHQLRDTLNPDGLILLLAVKNGIRIICRGTTDDINFGALMRNLNGGGHVRAASGMINIDYMDTADINDILDDAEKTVLGVLPDHIQPPVINLKEKLETQIPSDQLDLVHRVSVAAEQLAMSVYIVGGVVRDLLLDEPVMDFDIVVEGDATRLGKEVTARYGGRLELHSQFFTAKWTTPEGFSLDLISARSETYPAPAALPVVEMSGIEMDLRRRDFTLNTLAIRLDGDHFGELLDVCGGLRDLRNGMIRTLHDRSFIDDPTRLFRAVRFEQRLDFDLEPDTLRQLREQLHGVSNLTGQRIWHELRLFCNESCPEDDFSRIVHLGIAGQIHGAMIWNTEIEADCQRFRVSVPEKYWDEVPNIDSDQADEEGMLWVWFSKFSQKTVAELCIRLLLPKKTQRCIEGLLLLRERMPELIYAAHSTAVFFLETIPMEALYCYSLFCPENEKTLLKRFIAEWRHIYPASTGDDLIKMGMEPGPEIRKLLTSLRASCIDDGLLPGDEEEWIRSFVRRDK